MEDKFESELKSFITDQADFEIKEGATEKEVLTDFIVYLEDHEEIEVPEAIADFFAELAENDEIETVSTETVETPAPEEEEVPEKAPKKSSGGTVTVKCTMKRKISFSFGEFDFSSGEAEIPEEFVDLLCSMVPYSRA